MISFAVDPRFVQDLEDDFMVNRDKTMYQFIGRDPVKAFYLGINLGNWFRDIDRDQRYLYSKQARHNKDDLQKYQNQVSFWGDKFPRKDNEEVNLAELAEFIYNNMFWDEETEETDKIKLAFFFGDMIATQQSQQDAEKETSSSPTESNKDLQKETV